ncbi:unnamed protein product [Arctogadus glacialis]
MFTEKDIVLFQKPKIDKRGFWRPGSIRLGHQVNTLFCLIAAKRNKGRPKREKREIESERETERERERIMPEKESEKERERRQTLGEPWLQAFVSNLKTKSSGNIKTSFKNNINIFVWALGLYGTVLP